MKTNWLDRKIAHPGPYLALCLSEIEYQDAMWHLKVKCPPDWIQSPHAHATAHYIRKSTGEQCVVVCLRYWEGRSPVEVAGLLVHEAVHVWQEYADGIGESNPGREQEAYAIQSIAQELMAEFSRRMCA